MCADTGIPSDEPSGVLARSIGLLAKTTMQEEISLLSADWALGPFKQAEICDEAVALVSSSCAQGGGAGHHRECLFLLVGFWLHSRVTGS